MASQIETVRGVGASVGIARTIQLDGNEDLKRAGQHETALQWIDRAAEERLVGYYMPSVDPLYDAVRSDPRFQALLRRMNLDR